MGMSAKGFLNGCERLGASNWGRESFQGHGWLICNLAPPPCRHKKTTAVKKKHRNGTNNGGKISKIRPGNRENHEKTEIELAKGGSYWIMIRKLPGEVKLVNVDCFALPNVGPHDIVKGTCSWSAKMASISNCVHARFWEFTFSPFALLMREDCS